MISDFQLPDADALFPRPTTDSRAWLPWSESGCTNAVRLGIFRAIYLAMNRASDSPEEWAERQGFIRGLKKTLAIIKEEEAVSQNKRPNSTEEV